MNPHGRPGFGLAFVALLVSSAATSILGVILAPVPVLGALAFASSGRMAWAGFAAALVAITAVRTLVGALVVRWVVRLCDADVSLLRALAALLLGNVAACAVWILTILTSGGHVNATSYWVLCLLGSIVAVWIIGGGSTVRDASAMQRYTRPPGAPPGWPGA